MKNPFRSEAEAFRFLIGTVVYFAAIAIATALGGRWWGLGVFVVALGASALVWFFRRERARASRRRARRRARRRRRAADPRRRERDRRRGGAARGDPARRPTGGRASVLVVCPALNSPAQALGVGRGPGARRRPGAARPSLARARAARHRGARRGRRRRPAAGDRGRAPHLRRRRDHHLHPPRGPVELARAGRRHVGARALRGADHARRRRPRGRGRRGRGG